MKCQKCGFIQKTEATIFNELMANRLRELQAIGEHNGQWKTATEIAKLLGIKKPNMREIRAIGAYFSKNGREKEHFMRSNGRNLIKI